MSKEEGLKEKYLVTRTDGKPVGDCIVLEFKDPIARRGIEEWAIRMLVAGYTQVYYDVNEKLSKYWKKIK